MHARLATRSSGGWRSGATASSPTNTPSSSSTSSIDSLRAAFLESVRLHQERRERDLRSQERQQKEKGILPPSSRGNNNGSGSSTKDNPMLSRYRNLINLKNKGRTFTAPSWTNQRIIIRRGEREERVPLLIQRKPLHSPLTLPPFCCVPWLVCCE